jgi:hypothetical protein
VDTAQQHRTRSTGAAATPPAPVAAGLAEVVAVGAHRVSAAFAEPAATQGREQWLALAGDCQLLINTLTAVQDTAIAEAARRESVWCEDGTLGESVHAPGQVSLDAADVVAPVIGVSHNQAQRRVEQAVRLATGRVPVPADDRDVPEASGLRGLHRAMAAGHLDGYRAGVIAFELEVAPAHVADAIVTALSGHFTDEAATLRRRTRVLLSRISPDLVRERAKRARAATGLRRWVAEPGVDEWHGTFPSEDAAAAWAAIDRLAHDLVAAGTCTTIEQARGKSLTDLVTGNATIDVQVVLAVPAATVSHDPIATSSAEGPVPSAAQDQALTSSDQAKAVAITVQGERDASDIDIPGPLTTGNNLDGSRAQTSGPHQPYAARIDDSPSLSTPSPGISHTAADSIQTLGHDDDLVEVHGARPSEPLLVRRGWLRDHLAKAPPHPHRGVKRASPRFVPCDPLTGARLDPGDHLTTDTYRPGDQLAALVRARDGRCRFPGCAIAARFCDLDHVRPWPTGPTAARNLLTLCRRHHRIKQRPGWRLRVAPDGTATWTDPAGRERTTAPLDALQSLVLRADPTDSRLQTTTRLPTGEPTGEPQSWSALETRLGLRLEHHPGPRPGHNLWTHPTHRRCTSAASLRAGFARHRARAPFPALPPF